MKFRISEKTPLNLLSKTPLNPVLKTECGGGGGGGECQRIKVWRSRVYPLGQLPMINKPLSSFAPVPKKNQTFAAPHFPHN